jgi:hypothetical protein
VNGDGHIDMDEFGHIIIGKYDVLGAADGGAVSGAFPSWKRSMSTEIYLCHACSCHEVEDGKRPGRVP